MGVDQGGAGPSTATSAELQPQPPDGQDMFLPTVSLSRLMVSPSESQPSTSPRRVRQRTGEAPAQSPSTSAAPSVLPLELPLLTGLHLGRSSQDGGEEDPTLAVVASLAADLALGDTAPRTLRLPPLPVGPVGPALPVGPVGPGQAPSSSAQSDEPEQHARDGAAD